MASANSGPISQAAEKRMSAIGVQRMRPMLGTFCSIQVTDGGMSVDHEEIGRAINDAFGAIHRINELMHPVHGIDLALINHSSSQLIQINEWTWRVLQLAKQLYHVSDGIFDPCVPTANGCIRDIELLPDNQMICHAPVSLDLGGIAKGFAVDCAIDVLKRAGCSSALVNAGGDMRAMGESQAAYIKRSEQLIPLTLNNQALAVSEVGTPSRPEEHQGYYLHRATRAPAHKFVAVISDQAVVADALTKCVMWLSTDASAYLCQQFSAQLVIAD